MKIGRDKWKHFFVGIIMGAMLQLACMWLLPGQPRLASLLSFFAAVFISYGFELFSKFSGKGVYEVLDAVASVIGAVVGMLLIGIATS